MKNRGFVDDLVNGTKVVPACNPSTRAGGELQLPMGVSGHTSITFAMHGILLRLGVHKRFAHVGAFYVKY